MKTEKMNELKLLVEDKNMETVLHILENLKDGLISEIQSGTQIKQIRRTTQYQPKVNTIIREEESGTADKSGKYLNPTAYKNKIRK